MFNIDLQPFFTTPVTAQPPGEYDPQTFGAKFEALGVDEFNSFDLATAVGTKAFLERAWLSVSDVVDKDGNPVPDSTALRAQMIDLSWVRTPLVRAYLDGVSAGQAGN